MAVEVDRVDRVSGTKLRISIERESSDRSIASRSASSTMTNWPLAISKPRTISSCVTSRSCVGHQRFCLIGVAHSRCSSRKETSDWRAAGFVAGASPTGIETRPKLRDPFQEVRMVDRSKLVRWTRRIRRHHASRIPLSKLRDVTETAAATFGDPSVRRAPDDRASLARRRRLPAARPPPTSSRTRRAAGARCPGTTRTSSSAPTRTAFSPAASARATPFALLAQNSLDWALLDFALAQIGAVGVPIYANSSAARRRLPARALRGGRDRVRGRRAAREGRGGRRGSSRSSSTS